MAQFTIYSSADASAPVLHSNADANNLIALLDAVLVNGYGSKAAAGWTHPFAGSGTEQAYRGGSGTQRYLHILDDGSLTGGRRAAAVRAYETMAAVTDTTGLPFPNLTQEANALSWRKSTDISVTARPWMVFADNQTFYLLIATGDTGSVSSAAPFQWTLFMFGDFFSYTPGDLYNCQIIGIPSSQGFVAGGISINQPTVYMGDKIYGSVSQTGSILTQIGHYVNRTLSGTQNSTNNYKKGGTNFFPNNSQPVALQGLIDFPNGADGAAWLSPIYVMDSVVPEVFHGEYRGFYHQGHDVGNFGDGDIITAVGDRARIFQIVKLSPNSGVYVFETSDTLKTN